MNILIVTPGFPSNTVKNLSAKFVFNEALAYSFNGAKVDVVTPHYYPAPLKESFYKNITVYRFKYFFPSKFERIVDPIENIYNANKILLLIQAPVFLFLFLINVLKHSRKADIIHCQWTITALFALPAKWLFNKKIVMTARGSDIRLFPKWLNKFIHKQVDATIDCYGPQQWNDEYKKNFPANYIKLPLITEYNKPKEMPEDMKAILRGRDNLFKIIYLGRLDSLKINIGGVPVITLIHTANELRKRKKDFHIFYIGDGDISIKDEMRKLLSEYNLSNVISFLGAKNNVYDYLPYCNLGVGGTAFNAVSQEFSYCRKPQLLVKGHYNVNTPWNDKENALFFQAKDFYSLTNTILYAMEDTKRLEKIGINAYKMMTKYVKDIKKGGLLYLQAFQKIINEG